jgi:Family of unknown function (DUF6526)
MATQTFATHRHNPKLTGLGGALLLVAMIAFALAAFDVGGRWLVAVGVAAMIGVDAVLLTISRTYVTKLQDRIIRLEMTLRCARFLSPAQQNSLSLLALPQLVALRFASDDEIPALLERAERDRLAPDDIKRAIRNWVPDLMRT